MSAALGKPSKSAAAKGAAPAVGSTGVNPPRVNMHTPGIVKPKPYFGRKLPPWGKSTTKRAVGGHGPEGTNYIPSYDEVKGLSNDEKPFATDSDGRQYYESTTTRFPLLLKQVREDTKSGFVLVVLIPKSLTRKANEASTDIPEFPDVEGGYITLRGTRLRVIETHFPHQKATGYLLVDLVIS